MLVKRILCLIFAVIALSAVFPPLDSGIAQTASRSNKAKLKDYYLRARKELNKGDYEAALRYLSSCARIEPNSSLVCREMARAYLAMGKRLTAKQYIEKALVRAPKDKEIRLLAKLINDKNSIDASPSPKRPAKSLLIYDDYFFFGVKEELDNRRTKSRNDYRERRFGLSSRRYQLDTRTPALNRIHFSGAWVGSRLNRPGDLRSYLKNGALVFYFRSSSPGLNLQVGFQEQEDRVKKARHYQGSITGPTMLTVPLRDYLYSGEEWQKVIIPLAELKDEGYFLRNDDLTGDSLPYAVRHSLAYYWRSTDSFVHGSRTSSKNLTYWLDEVAVLPRYDHAEYAALAASAKKKRAAEVVAEITLFDDRPVSPFWVHGDGYSQVVLDETIRKQGKYSAHFIMSGSGERSGPRSVAQDSVEAAAADALEAQAESIEGPTSSGGDAPEQPASGRAPPDLDDKDLEGTSIAGISLPETDLSNFYPDGALEFYVRGETGEEHFKITLYSRYRMTEESFVVLEGVTAYTVIDQHWRKLSIPLVDFKLYTAFDWSRIIRFEIGSSPEPGNQVSFYIDDLKFVRRPTIKGNVSKE
jgi:hypothetical protein